MNDRQQLGKLLNLVDHDLADVGVSSDQLRQALGTRAVAARRLWIEQVEAESGGQGGLRPEQLARSAGPEEEEAAALRRPEEAGYELHFGAQKGNTTSILNPRRARKCSESCQLRPLLTPRKTPC